MPTPSFDELLARAREIAQNDADSRTPRTGELAARGVSEFVNNLLGAPVGERRTVGGYISPKGDFQTVKPYTTGGNLMQVLAQRMVNGPQGPSPVPEGSYPLTSDQTGEFAVKSALERQRTDSASNVANIRAKAMVDAARLRGNRSSAGVLSSTIPDVLKNAVYDEMERRMGTTIGPDDRTPLNLAHLREFRQEGYIGDDFTRRMIPVLKDKILGLPQDAIDKVFSMSQEYNENRFPGKTPPKPKGSLTGKKQSYSSDADAVAAFKGGKVKSGETVSINGEDVVMR